jgi:bifunctional non-homologous end joining protein LigD
MTVAARPSPAVVTRAGARDLRPMLASLADAPLCDDHLAYEPKYDGIRAIADVESGARARVQLWSRLGNEKTAQFPEVTRALQDFARRLKSPVVLDGEIVALDEAGEPAGFQRLQSRIHVTNPGIPAGRAPGQGVAFIAFDVLYDGHDDLRELPLTARRARLERILVNSGSPVIRMSEFIAGDGRELEARARARGWEGLIAKRLDSRYRSGRRSPDWRKLKFVHEQEFVVGGWTDPRRSRQHFGALLLGVYDGAALEYVGHSGTGFSDAELARVWKLLVPLETRTCPFHVCPKTNERPHWAEPRLVAEVKFTEWTDDGRLRHPTYLGLRDDVRPEDVRRERKTTRSRVPAVSAEARRRSPSGAGLRARDAAGRPGLDAGGRRPTRNELNAIIEQLQAIEADRGDGTITLPDGVSLAVSNLRKVYWPEGRITKGELLRYYVAVSPYLLPAVADRPLVMKRFPNGIRGKAFYQQRAPEAVPAGVRVEVLPDDHEVPSRLVGGSLTTLLYMAQLGTISQDPWFSRVATPAEPDCVALDLDPMPGTTFARILDVARWARDELNSLGVSSVPKTSGADGLHVYLPLEPGTPYAAGMLFCQIVATVIAQKHPKAATVTRSVHARGTRIYVDYLQNIQGKTLATAYSARASDFAGVSTPLRWEEVDAGVHPKDFTIRTAVARLEVVGDLWAKLGALKPADLRTVLRYAEPGRQ